MSTPGLLELVNEYEEGLNEKRPEDSFYAVFSTRDRLAKCLERGGNFTFDELRHVSELDARLRRLLQESANVDLGDLRDVLQPPKRHWWWHYAKRRSLWWTIAAVFLLTLSLALITDFSRRLLSSDPDEAGILSIAVQAALALAASTTFTAAGRRTFAKLLSRFHVPVHDRSLSQFVAAAFLFAVVFLAWQYGPGQLAIKANNEAVSSKDPEVKLRLYSRAISLNPELAHAHFNLGELFENDYRYNEAAAEYQKAILSNPSDQNAYNNLARVLLLNKQPIEALRATDDGLRLGSGDDAIKAVIYKNESWAEYDLGFYVRAEQDARLAIRAAPNFAPSYCILGKILNEVGKTTDAKETWQLFMKLYSTTDPEIVKIEPDCVRLAGEALYESK